MSELFDIPGISDYKLDVFGNVWSLKKGQGGRYKEPHLMGIWTDPNGYSNVTLKDNGKSVRYMVHVLMCKTFYGAKPQGLTVAHLDGNPSNNSIYNLKYMTHKANINQRWEHGTMIYGEKSHLSKICDSVAKQIWRCIKSGMRNKDIVEKYGVSKSYVSAMKAGRMRKHITGIGLIETIGA